MQYRFLSMLLIFFLILSSENLAICQSKLELIKKGEQSYYDGKDLFYDGQYRLARAKYDETLKIYTENLEEPHELLFKIYHRILRNETKLRNFPKAKDLGRKALLNATEVFGEFSDETATIYTAFGLLAFKERRLIDAIDYNNKAIEISTKLYGLESKETAIPIMNNANNYSDKGDQNKAIDMAEFALQIFNKTLRKDHQNFNRIYLNLSNMYRYKGDLQKALDYGEKALEIKVKNYKESHPSVSKYYANLGKILASMRRFEESEKYFKKSIEISRNSYGYYSPEVGNGINDMARIFLKEDNLEKAFKAYTEASEILSRTNLTAERKSAVKINLAVVEYDLGLKDKAIEKINEVVDELKINEKDYQPILTEYYTLLASMYRHNNDLEKAELAIKSAYIHFAKMDENDESSMFKLALEKQTSKLLLQNGSKDKLLDAKSRINQSISELTKLRKSYLGSSSKSNINEYLAENFELGVEVGQKLNEIDPNYENLNYVYSTIERAKAASFWDNDSEQDAYNFGGASTAIISDIENLKSNISSTEQELRLTEDFQLTKMLKDSLFRDKRKLESLFDKIETEYPKYYELKYNLKDHDIVDLQSKIGNDLAVLDYFILNGQSLCIYISKNNAMLFENGIEQNIEDLLIRKNKRFSPKESNMLYDAFFAKLNKQLKKDRITRVAIVPHEYLHFLSFEQLKSPESGKFLISDYAFSYQLRSEDVIGDFEVASTSTYLGFAPEWRNVMNNSLQVENISRDSRDSRDILFSLPGTLEEVKRSSNLLKGKILISEDAKESTFKENAHKYKILHFATHAHLDPKNDANSCLYMNEFNEKSTINGDDGKLYSNEIADMKLNADLVILSACNTGNGKINSGEGVMSLSRAFKFAGANSILMSLWLSNDQSSVPIITNFVSNLKKGMPKDVALQQAKLKYLSSADPMMKDEFYWSGFMINGELSPIMKNTSWKSYFYILPILFILYAFWHRYKMVKK